jgi:5-methylcytosine-specific restriction endonuclease McrA
VCGRPALDERGCPDHRDWRRERDRTSRHAGRYDEAWQRVRLVVLERDGYVCQWCGAAATTVDHVVELAAGGDRLELDNLVAACRPCNGRRSARVRRTIGP